MFKGERGLVEFLYSEIFKELDSSVNHRPRVKNDLACTTVFLCQELYYREHDAFVFFCVCGSS